MNGNQSLHISIKEPPNPNPTRTLGVFDDPDSPFISQLISQFLSENQIPKTSEFNENVKDEVIKLLTTHRILAVSRSGNITSVHFGK